MKRNAIELLQKSGAEPASQPAETTPVTASATDTAEALNKAIADLAAEDNAEELEKAKKGKKHEEKETAATEAAEEAAAKEDEGEDEGDNEDEGEELPFKKKGMKKSLVEEVANDPEASAAMDVEPFLKSLTEAISARFDSIEETLEKMGKAQSAQSRVIVEESRLVKSLAELNAAAGDEPMQRKGLTTKTQERFEPAPEGLTKSEAMARLIEFSKAGKLNPVQVSIIEGRLNKGIALPEYFTSLLPKGE